MSERKTRCHSDADSSSDPNCSVHADSDRRCNSGRVADLPVEWCGLTDDELRPAKGVVTGVAIGIVMWIVAFCAAVYFLG